MCACGVCLINFFLIVLSKLFQQRVLRSRVAPPISSEKTYERETFPHESRPSKAFMLPERPKLSAACIDDGIQYRQTLCVHSQEFTSQKYARCTDQDNFLFFNHILAILEATVGYIAVWPHTINIRWIPRISRFCTIRLHTYLANYRL